jgi:hypothetical protein
MEMSKLKVIWEKVVHCEKPIIYLINLGNGTQFKLISFYHRSKLFVALERLGAFFFDCERFKSGDYVSEKLNICMADANIIADWINCQLDKYEKQQGVYSLHYLNEGDIGSYYDFVFSISPTVLNHE